MIMGERLKAVALVGSTGSGKSSLALELAEKDDLCIISCDSMQVYQGLDIGTSKASKEEQKQVRHALIDCTTVSNIWNAQMWATSALTIIKQENKQGKIPIIVGGTGMYLKALTYGFVDIPAEKKGVRESFEAMQKAEGTPFLHVKLQGVDPNLAARLEMNDTQRIIRGLCVFHSTGVALSDWQSQQQQVTEKSQARLDCPTYVLDAPTAELRQRIKTRFLQMIENGWLEETIWLKSLNLPDTHPVMRAVGYRQLLDNLNGSLSLEQAVIDGVTATRKYAKRQRTWFRNQTSEALHGSKLELKKNLESKLLNVIL